MLLLSAIIYYLVPVLLWFEAFENVLAFNNTTDILSVSSSALTHGLLLERDLLRGVNISLIPSVGVNFTSLLGPLNADYFGNVTNKSDYVNTILQTGVTSIGLDITFKSQQWYIVDTDLSFLWFLNIIGDFLTETSSDVGIEPFFVVFKVRCEKNCTSSSRLMDNQSFGVFNSTVTTALSTNLIFTPSDYDNYWPTVNDFLFTQSKRLIFFNVNENDIVQTQFVKNDYIVFHKNYTNYEYITVTEQGQKCPVTNNTAFPIISSSSFTSSSINHAVYCGYQPLISSGSLLEIPPLLNASLLWGWGPGQPLNTHALDPLVSDSRKSSSLACASLQYNISTNSSSWQVDNCYNKLPILCYNENSNEWAITTNVKSRFLSLRSDGLKESIKHGCPSGYYFSVPHSPTQISELNSFLSEQYEKDPENFYFQDSSTSVWVALNSISAANCWVVGGSRTICPYAKYVSTRNFIKMITPSAVCIGALVIAVFLLKFRKIPIQNNRRQWKRIMKDTEAETPLDGVPS